MIVTKKEFQKMFGFNDASSVSHLLRDEKIVANDAGMIDLDHKTNKKWAKAREKTLIKRQKAETQTEEPPKTKEGKNQIGTEIELLNQRLLERQKKTTLLDLKIAKERKEVIETEVLNRVIMTVFDSLFKNLAELPSVYIDDIVSTVKSSNAPKEKLVKFLTDKIISCIYTVI